MPGVVTERFRPHLISSLYVGPLGARVTIPLAHCAALQLSEADFAALDGHRRSEGLYACLQLFYAFISSSRYVSLTSTKSSFTVVLSYNTDLHGITL